jgi:hypothetical protein
MLHYQIGELDGSYKSSYFTHIFIPRLVYALSGLQMLYLIFSLFFKQLLWKSLPSKKERVFAFFTLLLTSTVPSWLMLAGPYHQVFFLLMTAICYSLNYVLNKAGLRNSYFFYTTYVFVTLFFYLATEHALNYLMLRFSRVYVGFPNFHVATNSINIFFEMFGIFSYTMALVPLLSVINGSVSNNQQGITSFLMEIASEQQITKEESTVENKQESLEDTALEITIARNYLMMLINYEVIHDGLTGHLLADYFKLFVAVSPSELTMRFIDWYIYILTIVFEFVIAKL